MFVDLPKERVISKCGKSEVATRGHGEGKVGVAGKNEVTGAGHG